MKRWRLQFHGRPSGSIGVTRHCEVDVEAETAEQARLKAWDTHDHIAGGTDGVLAEEFGCCEHGDHPAPPGRRFCSIACARCEHESKSEETGCDNICNRGGLDG